MNDELPHGGKRRSSSSNTIIASANNPVLTVAFHRNPCSRNVHLLISGILLQLLNSIAIS